MLVIFAVYLMLHYGGFPYFLNIIIIWFLSFNQMYQKNNNNNNLQPVCRWPLGRYFKKEKKLFN